MHNSLRPTLFAVSIYHFAWLPLPAVTLHSTFLVSLLLLLLVLLFSPSAQAEAHLAAAREHAAAAAAETGKAAKFAASDAKGKLTGAVEDTKSKSSGIKVWRLGLAGGF